MNKLNVAIIGQGRSGKNIHGKYFRSEANTYYNVKYVVDEDAFRREVAEQIYPGCTTFSDYTQLFELDDIDLVVNSTFSDLHYPITKDLLLHGKNVLVEKPFARSRYECDELIKIAKDKGVTLAVFQQTFLAPFYMFAYELTKSGQLGDIKQVSIRYNGFARRWDWQTLQKKCAGSTYNTGPHPIGMALGFLDFDKNARVAYSKLDTALTSGDADDYAKIILTAPNKPVVDIEISSIDAYSGYNLKIQGTKGTFKATPAAYEMTYIVDGENPERPVIEQFLKDENGNPVYCSEKLEKHVEAEKFSGTAFDIGTASLYSQLYFKITEGTPMTVTPEMAADIISIIETVHAQNPLPLKYRGGKLMKKIAILGCENSHADAFLTFIKEKAEFSDVEVVGVYSDDAAAAQKLNEKFGAPVMNNYTDAVGKVDGIMVTARHGDNHFKYAKPYIESGIPMFIDKPITVSESDALEFMAQLKKNNVCVTGGSSLKHDDVIMKFKKNAEDEVGGKTIGGYVRAPYQAQNDYGGFFFYAPHLIEMVCQIFGNHPLSVTAKQNGKQVHVLFHYENYDCVGLFCDSNYVYYASRMSEKGADSSMVTFSKDWYYREFKQFYDLLCGTAAGEDYSEFIAPVFVMNAVNRSLENGNTEAVGVPEV